jgi:dTDP-4-dehydrorhamnose 3,5-epimerase
MLLLEGTLIRPLKKNCDERGYLCELIRSDGAYYYPFAMCYYSVSSKGVIRAWHRHPRTQQRDTFIVIQGMAKVCAYDMETNEFNEHFIGDDNMVSLTINGKFWHGFKAVSDKPVILLNFPDRLYDYKNPDEERLPYNTEKIPYDWDIKMK